MSQFAEKFQIDGWIEFEVDFNRSENSFWALQLKLEKAACFRKYFFICYVISRYEETEVILQNQKNAFIMRSEGKKNSKHTKALHRTFKLTSAWTASRTPFSALHWYTPACCLPTCSRVSNAPSLSGIGAWCVDVCEWTNQNFQALNVKTKVTTVSTACCDDETGTENLD